jgi:hypothetical protein
MKGDFDYLLAPLRDDIRLEPRQPYYEPPPRGPGRVTVNIEIVSTRPPPKIISSTVWIAVVWTFILFWIIKVM